MKTKIMLFGALIASLFILSSCNSSSSEDPTYRGVMLYTYAVSQHDYSAQPTYIMLRMGALLREASEATGKDISDLTTADFEELTYTLGSVSLPLQSVLFGSGITGATITNQGSGLWTIEYPADYTNSYDSYKTGTAYISTGGHHFDESGYDWTIDFSDAFRVGSSSTPVRYKADADYRLSSNGMGSWTITVTGFECYYQNSAVSDWTGTFHLTQAGSVASVFSAQEFFGSEFTLSGSASGKTMYDSTAEFGYRITEPLHYYTISACSATTFGHVRMSGDETAYINTLTLPEGHGYWSYYPEMTVSVSSVKQSACNYYMIVTYNGYTKTYS